MNGGIIPSILNNPSTNNARPHPEAPKEGEEILYIGTKTVEPSPDLYQSLRERIDEIEEDDDDGDIVVRR